MNSASSYLLALAKLNLQVYIANPKAKAAMVTGSVAQGLCDFYSDIDMSVYYDILPSEEELQVARRQNQGSERLWTIGDRGEGVLVEAYYVRGVECQIGHTTIAACEQDLATVLQQLDVTTPMQKVLSGILDCIPLYGEALIQQWKAKAANYPDALAQAMIERHLQFFPIWGLQENYFGTRDATLWQYQVLVETVQNILGTLAALNRLYYSTFQFKHMGLFVEKMKITPPNLYPRLENLFQCELQSAASQLQELVQETVELVELHMPLLDTSQVRRKLSWRHQAWKPMETTIQI